MLERERKLQQGEVDKKVLVLKEREKVTNLSVYSIIWYDTYLPPLQQLKLTQMKIKEITKFIKASAAENDKSKRYYLFPFTCSPPSHLLTFSEQRMDAA